jgi:hypothetical protein
VGAGSLWPLGSFNINYVTLRNVLIFKKILFSRAIFCEEITESFEIFWHIPLLNAKIFTTKYYLTLKFEHAMVLPYEHGNLL